MFICSPLNAMQWKCRNQWINQHFTETHTSMIKDFIVLCVLFGVLIISANSCRPKSFFGALEHEVELRSAGKHRWSSQQGRSWAFQGVLDSQDIQGHYSGRGLLTKKQFWDWWSQRFDNLPFSSRVSARSLKCSNSNFGLFLTFP